MNATTLTQQAQSGNKINWGKAVFAGIMGTIVFDVIGLAFTGQFWDIPALLAGKLFGEGMLPLGVLAHYGNGVAIAVIYAGLAPSLWGNAWMRAFTFITVETVFGVFLFMMPLLGLGAFGLNAGIALPLISLARHLGYGVALAGLYPFNEN